MAVAHVANRGTNTVKAAGTTSLTVTTSGAVAAYGSLVFCSVALGTTAGTTVTVSGGGVTWVTASADISTWSYTACHAAYFPSGLASGTTLTVTWSNSCTAAAASVHEFSGLGEPTMQVGSIGQYGASTTPSTGAFSNTSGNLVIGIVTVNGPSGDSFTQDTDTLGGSWGTITSAGTTGASQTSNITLRGGYKVATTSDSQTYNPTLGTSRTWAADGYRLVPGTVPTVVSSSFTGDSSVQATVGSTFPADGYTKNTPSGSVAADGYTGLTARASLPADASVQFPAPVWVSPANGASVVSTTPLVWTSVVSASDAKFHIQLDTLSDFSAATSYYSSSGSYFDYWDGSTWVVLPPAGMPAAKTGNNVRFTPPLTSINATRYRRVRQSY